MNQSEAMPVDIVLRGAGSELSAELNKWLLNIPRATRMNANQSLPRASPLVVESEF